LHANFCSPQITKTRGYVKNNYFRIIGFEFFRVIEYAHLSLLNNGFSRIGIKQI